MTEFSDHTLDKATKAKVTLENYYSNLITQHGERKQRLAKLEASLKDETLSETQKQVSGGRYAWRRCESNASPPPRRNGTSMRRRRRSSCG